MLGVKFFKRFFNLNVLLQIYLIWSNHFWLVEPSAKSNGYDAFRKLFEKNTSRTDQENLQTTIFQEKVVTASPLPASTVATPALSAIPDEITQTIGIISNKQEASETESSYVSIDASVASDSISLIEERNQSEALEESTAAANETVNGTLPSSEAEQASESEVMPSFDEWKRRMLAEQNVKIDKIAQPASIPTKKGQNRNRNYASYECGAKIVAANSEAESTGRILNEQMDEYMLNPCRAKIWFVIELCETIQVSQIEIANLELFSSLPKDLNIYWSDRFPTREWTSLGGFVAQDYRTFQSFNLQQQGYGKFMKIEMLSHYGTEHYCPLSVVRVFGTSMVDEYEEMETVHHPSEDEEDRLDVPSFEGKDSTSKDLFGTAKEAVYNMVRKAAQALTRENDGSAMNTTDSNLFISNKTEEMVWNNMTQSLHERLVECGLCCNLNGSRDSFSNATYCRFMHVVLGPGSRRKKLCDRNLCQCALQPNVPIQEKPAEITNATAEIVATLTVDVEEELATINASSAQEQPSVGTVDSQSFLLVTPLVLPSASQHPLLQPSVEETPESSTLDSIVLQETIQPSPASLALENEMMWNEVEPKLPSGNGGAAAQKESVFVRLNNRIKGLESNLSLSTLYLQELSQRYRRQMEDMQRVFNRTVAALNETAHKAADKDARQQETIHELQESVAALSKDYNLVMAERHAIYRQVYEAHLFLIVTEVIVMVTVLSLCLRRVTLAATPKKQPAPATLYSSPLKRHCSVSSLHSTPSGEKKRRPSGDFSLPGSYGHLMIVEPIIPIFVEPVIPPKLNKKKNKNKKLRHLHKSLSNPNLATFTQSSHSNNNENGSKTDRLPSARQSVVPFQNLSNGILEQQSKDLSKNQRH